MASTDHTAQFQEPPVDITPEATSSTSEPERDTSTQFQEPITPHSSTDSSSTNTSTTTNSDTALHKTTTEKLKDAVKKPFTSSSSSESSHKLGKRDITSPEMAAANEVLAAKDLKSP